MLNQTFQICRPVINRKKELKNPRELKMRSSILKKMTKSIYQIIVLKKLKQESKMKILKIKMKTQLLIIMI
jgi:hypothetical protein